MQRYHGTLSQLDQHPRQLVPPTPPPLRFTPQPSCPCEPFIRSPLERHRRASRQQDHGMFSLSARKAKDETPETCLGPPCPQTPGNSTLGRCCPLQPAPGAPPPAAAVAALGPSPREPPLTPAAILSGELNGPEMAEGLGAGMTRVSPTSSRGGSHSLPPQPSEAVMERPPPPGAAAEAAKLPTRPDGKSVV